LGISAQTYSTPLLLKDNIKGLGIAFNYLNQPECVSKSSVTINFIYDATGKKVAKKFTGKPNHYYMDGIEYSGNTLLFAMTEEGRVRPGSNGSYTYDYFLKDHLGNVRVVLSSETPPANTYPVATMEDGNASVENLYYANIDNTRDVKPSGFDDNPVNQNVARLTSSESTRQKGPSITLKVNTGDKIDLSVNSFYHSGADYNRYVLGETALSQLLSALLSPMALSGVAQATATDAFNNQAFGNSTNFQNMVGALPNSNYNSPPSNTPKAYLVWMLFDNEFKLIKTGNSSGMMQVPSGADQRNTMAQTDITMDKSGFFYAYVVNESPTNVYFDDFQVSLTSGPVLEENNYFPFGMLNAQLSAPGIADPKNMLKYNGKELQKELSLEWLSYGARFYDPQIGRWHSPDQLAENAYNLTPYRYCYNNPVNYTDPFGLWEQVRGGYSTSDPGDIAQLFTYIQGENLASNNSISNDQIFTFANLSAGGGGGGYYTLSNGSRLILNSINITGSRKSGETLFSNFSVDRQSFNNVWKEVQSILNQDFSKSLSLLDIASKVNTTDRALNLTMANTRLAQKFAGIKNFVKLPTIKFLGEVTGYLTMADNLYQAWDNPAENWYKGLEALGLGALMLSGVGEGTILIYNLSTMALDVSIDLIKEHNNNGQ
jgi:RHS repeat-associated protein